MEIIRVRFIEKEESLGCEKAPTEVLEFFREITCNENGDLIEKNKLRFEEIHVNLDDKEEAEYLIFENSREVFERNFKVFFIGGDNSVNFSMFRAFDKVEKDPLIIVFDAHCGCRTSDLMNRNWLKRLLEKGFLGRKIILVGTRNFENAKEFLNENGILSITMDLLDEDLEGICDLIMERTRKSSGFFVNIDMDVIDPGSCPGVNIIEPGGIANRDFIYFIKRLSKLNNFKGSSLIGINPERDIRGMTSKLGAKLLAEMM